MPSRASAIREPLKRGPDAEGFSRRNPEGARRCVSEDAGRPIERGAIGLEQ